MLRLRRMPLAQLRLRALLKPSQSKPYGFASSPKGESFIKVKIMSETKLSHFDASGSAVMVDVSEKPVTARQAVARGIITMNAAAFAAVRDGTAQKGDVLGVARIAGIMAAKRTSELIPLCHPLPLSKLTVDFHLLPEQQAVEAVCTARTIGVTGVEMEALTGVSAALLTIYDMCKAVEAAGADGISLCNTFQACAIDLEKRRPVFNNTFAGLSGPAIRPIALRMVWQAVGAVNIPVIGLGGILTGRDALEFIMAGAAAVQVGTANFLDPKACTRITAEMGKWMDAHGVKTLDEIRGCARG